MSPLLAIAIVLASGLLVCSVGFLLLAKIWDRGEPEYPEPGTTVTVEFMGREEEWIATDPPTWEWDRARRKGFMRQLQRDPKATNPFDGPS